GGPDNLPVTFQFTDTSTGSPNKWLWDFGDGFTSESQNPSHTYAATGSYIVKLKAFVQTGVTDVTQVFVSGRERTGAGSTGIIGAYNNWLAASWVNKPPGTSEVRWSLNLYWPWWWFVAGDAVFSYNLVPYSSGVAELQIYLYPISGGNNHGVIITGSGQLIDSSVATGWRTVKDVSGSLGTLIQESYTNHDGYPNNGAGGYYSTTSRVRVWVSTDIDTDCQSVLVWP
ncbi:MAG: PKD domain-containing protein, partial [Planctomycetes bacterium]|nr:PKD domain-containing protein [Planctomycetota bacterium]